jgi:hypothetical protein
MKAATTPGARFRHHGNGGHTSDTALPTPSALGLGPNPGLQLGRRCGARIGDAKTIAGE